MYEGKVPPVMAGLAGKPPNLMRPKVINISSNKKIDTSKEGIGLETRP